MAKEISNAVIRRLPRYYRYLDELLENGVDRISSGDLSKSMHITASQIRQDLNNFGGFGQQGYGYNVQYLHNEIGKILGVDKVHNMIVVGMGNLGQAISRYSHFENLGFKMIGFFDVNPQLAGKTIRDIPIRLMDELPSFIKNNKVDMAALTVPRSHAADVTDQLVNLGIKGIWNFALLDLDVPDSVVVQNVHLADSLMELSYNYRIQNQSDETQENE